MLKTAQSALLSGKQQVVQLQNIIAQANTANPATLEVLNASYVANIININYQLQNASFDRRNLFNGTDNTNCNN
ncbi:hypothetical protein [Candidatus Trichorickettsia mobilis]|uniref:hypothetical protein n=1 Tax=Candidatus Trichorickettsia mobilis TaxID=1346319 RepID=UPI00292EB509|nr:hypothetical protein [Candidatus Trichorickettsia mobilis]